MRPVIEGGHHQPPESLATEPVLTCEDRGSPCRQPNPSTLLPRDDTVVRGERCWRLAAQSGTRSSRLRAIVPHPRHARPIRARRA